MTYLKWFFFQYLVSYDISQVIFFNILFPSIYFEKKYNMYGKTKCTIVA